MTTDLEVRPATTAEADDIVRIVRSGLAPELLDLFTYGCSGIVRYIAEQIEASRTLGESQYTVALIGGQLVGCIELRIMRERLFVNYISVVQGVRSTGIGPRLLMAALERARTPAHSHVALDVVESNTAAIRWYDALGFDHGVVTEWFQMKISAETSGDLGVVSGAPQAAVTHCAFGFSRVSVTTASAQHDVGKLGSRWFRVTDRGALLDQALLRTLRHLDSRRDLLALLPIGSLPTEVAASTSRVTATFRRATILDDLVERSRSRLGVRRA